jgi:hypothetical protein
MKTSTFTKLVEQAIVEVYGESEKSEFDTVPYLDDDGQPKYCLGIFITEIVHMAAVAATAMLIISQDDEYTQEDLEHFPLLMGLFRIAPYMQWHCAYFPGLTKDDEYTDVLTEKG